MKKVLLLDDEKNYLAETIKELKLAGCYVTYTDAATEAQEFIAQHKNELSMVVVSLNNALGYPAVRKINRSIEEKTQLCIYTCSESSSLREWIYKQNITSVFAAPKEKNEFVQHCKRVVLRKNIHFNHSQLVELTNVLSKYTDSADNLVQKHSANSNSIQELQHKLARSLSSFEHQKNFLTEVQ